MESALTPPRKLPTVVPAGRVGWATGTWPEKHNWRYISRATPPKRDASERIRDFREIYGLFDEATVRAQASRCINCGEPRCMQGCPLGNRIPEWLSLTAQGRFLEAAELSQSTSNMPEICSRVCPQERLCEGACILNARSDPVAIGAVERFINEYAFKHNDVDVAVPPPNGLSVAVVGSGPGGLACADQLVKLGYTVTVFEAQNRPGGLLVNGIPSFKLEKSIIERRLDVLRRRGVQFVLKVKIGHDISLASLRAQFDAVYLAIGAQKPKELDMPGANLPGIFHALPFLIQKNIGEFAAGPPVEINGKRVAVLGGGDTAMDCLRTAIRCGAKEAICIYRRDFENMPGSRKEYFNAIDEGAQFMFLTNPVALLSNGSEVSHARCIRMELGEPDAKGRRKPREIAGSEFEVPVDVILIAYGFDPVPIFAAGNSDNIDVNSWGGVVVDENQMTSVPGIFAGGDLVRGPDLVVRAVRDSRNAAAGIHKYLSGKSKTHSAHWPNVGVCSCS